MPVPTKTPTRLRSSLRQVDRATRPAPGWRRRSANWLTRSSMRSCGGSKCSAPSNCADAASGAASRCANGASSRWMPERPAQALAKTSAASLPSGETTPMPVTATRLMRPGSCARGSHAALGRTGLLRGDEVVDVAHDVADGRQRHRFGRQRDLELVLDVEQQFGDAERVDAQRLERRIGHQRGRIELVVLDQDRAQSFEVVVMSVPWESRLRRAGGRLPRSGCLATPARRPASAARASACASAISGAGLRGRIARCAKPAARRSRGANCRRHCAA